GVRLHTHVAETLDEERFCLERFGKRPVELMEDLGWAGEDVWYAHAIHLSDSEIESVAAARTGVAHCPSSNMRLDAGICRVAGLALAPPSRAQTVVVHGRVVVRECRLLTGDEVQIAREIGATSARLRG